MNDVLKEYVRLVAALTKPDDLEAWLEQGDWAALVYARAALVDPELTGDEQELLEQTDDKFSGVLTPELFEELMFLEPQVTDWWRVTVTK